MYFLEIDYNNIINNERKYLKENNDFFVFNFN